MGVAITGLALTPSYAMIGPAAPALVLLFPPAQGFAAVARWGRPRRSWRGRAAHRRGVHLSMQ
jgi:hypothetical protein